MNPTGPDTAAAPIEVNEMDSVPASARAHAPQVRNVFFLLDSFEVGGTETQAVELARGLASAGRRVTLGVLRAEGPLAERLEDSAVSVMEFRPRGGIDSPGGIYQLLRLAAFLRRGRFDVVHTHDLWSNLMGVPAGWLARVPVIISSRRDLAHLAWYEGSRRVWLRRIQSLSHAVLTNSTVIRQALISDDRFAPEKVRVIPNGIDLKKFSRRFPDRTRIFPGPFEGSTIVLVGNMHTDVKGHPWLISAAAAVIREFPKTRFAFVGDGQQRSTFERQVAGLGLGQNFLFLGRRSDVPEILACSDIGVLPSQAEGLPNALLEYLAAGLAVVASHVGGNVEIVEDGQTGLLVPPQDSQALAAAILRLLRDPDLARRLAQSGHNYVAQKYSFERLVDSTDQLYTELLGGQRIC